MRRAPKQLAAKRLAVDPLAAKLMMAAPLSPSRVLKTTAVPTQVATAPMDSKPKPPANAVQTPACVNGSRSAPTNKPATQIIHVERMHTAGLVAKVRPVEKMVMMAFAPVGRPVTASPMVLCAVVTATTMIMSAKHGPQVRTLPKMAPVMAPATICGRVTMVRSAMMADASRAIGLIRTEPVRVVVCVPRGNVCPVRTISPISGESATMV